MSTLLQFKYITERAKDMNLHGRLRCAVLYTRRPEDEIDNNNFTGERKSGFIQISPSRAGPWTTVRLNYAAPTACWRLGDDVVASEVSVKDDSRYVNIRSLVSVSNSTDFIIDLCLNSKDSNQKKKAVDDNSVKPEDDEFSEDAFETDEYFETQKFDLSIGWVNCLPHTASSSQFSTDQGHPNFELPSGWEVIDDWHVDKTSVRTGDGWVYAPDQEIVQVILEQNNVKEHLAAKVVRIYSPYWIASARCPPLTYRLVDISSRKGRLHFFLPYHSSQTENNVRQITEDEVREGYTIDSGLNLRRLGLSVSISRHGKERFGPVKDLGPLGGMDGSIDLYAYDADGNCIRLFVSSKPSPYQSVPTKVIIVRPFMTFTNRIGQDMFIKLNSGDQPKVLYASDARVSFIYSEADGPEKLQLEVKFDINMLKENSKFFLFPPWRLKILVS
ncbi:hypothetical protein ACLOJK_034051 [Asimina triloba]